MSIHLAQEGRDQYAAFDTSRGVYVRLGTATRIGIGRWVVVTRIGTTGRTYRRRSAVRMLRRLATELLTRKAIARARLASYRPGFDDRLAKARGWRR